MSMRIELNYSLGQMIIKHEILSRYDDYEFKILIPLLIKCWLVVYKGKSRERILENQTQAYSFYVPNEIPISQDVKSMSHVLMEN